MVPNYIERVTVDIYSGTLAGTIEFQPHLNIIGGENGTLKTLLLQQLKTEKPVAHIADEPLRIQAVSPKRNSERRAALQMLKYFRQQGRTLDNVFSERLGAKIKQWGFENYPSLGELYYLVYEHRCRDGGDQQEHMASVTDEFNLVIAAIFEHYKLVSEWNTDAGTPVIRISKDGAADFPLEGLSTGEGEILGLVTSLYTSRDRIDVYVIDEPEVHLNWHLEERLFAFLDDLCETHEKQAIVATHSRAMFKPRYLPKTIFLHWDDDGRIAWTRKLTAEQYRRIAGEAIDVIRLGGFTKPTFFVEDTAHSRFLESLARVYGVEIGITECGNSSNVISLYRLSLREEGWQNTYFLVDGDNEGLLYPGSQTFIQLSAYCSDNYLIDPDVLAAVADRTAGECQQIILGEIKARRTAILKRNKFFDFVIDSLQPSDLTFERLSKLDASEIVAGIAKRLSLSVSELTDRTIELLFERGSLRAVLPDSLISAFEMHSENDERVP